MRPAFAVGVVLLGSLWGALLPLAATAAVPAAGLAGPTYYLISLDRAPLDEATEAVLVQSMRSTVVVDPDLEAEITFHVSEALTTTELAEQFSVALAEEGVALVRSGEGYRLMDLQSALVRRPRLDIVSVPAPEMLPAARALSPLSVPSTPIAVTEPVGGGGEQSVLPLLLLVAVAGAATWLLWRQGRFSFVRILLGRRISAREPTRDRDAVIDRLLVTHEVDLSLLAGACEIASRRSWPVEQVLCDLGGVSDAALAEAYAEVTGLERWHPADRPRIAPGSGPDRLVALLGERTMALIEADEWAVTIATSDPLDHAAFADVSRLCARMVTLVVAPRSTLTETPFRDTGSANPRLDRLIIPWAGRRDMDGAALLQAILGRRAVQPSSPDGLPGPLHGPLGPASADRHVTAEHTRTQPGPG